MRVMADGQERLQMAKALLGLTAVFAAGIVTGVLPTVVGITAILVSIGALCLHIERDPDPAGMQRSLLAWWWDWLGSSQGTAVTPPSEDSAKAPAKLTRCLPGDSTFTAVVALLQNTWFKKEPYELGEVIAVDLIENPRSDSAYKAYLESVGGVLHGKETLVFHGCAETAMDVANAESIIQTGFLKKYWKTSAGDWQRFGPGF